jgi:hypothetical protein
MEEYMGKEINLWEFRLETDIQIKIDEFGKLVSTPFSRQV